MLFLPVSAAKCFSAEQETLLLPLLYLKFHLKPETVVPVRKNSSEYKNDHSYFLQLTLAFNPRHSHMHRAFLLELRSPL